MGIINVTPDSFSDGGKFDDAESAVRQAQFLAASGASVLDLGAESTRPGATPISPEVEWKRLQPALEAILDWRKTLGDEAPRISVDTRHAEVARQALHSGADWINDVSGLTDPEMIAAVRDSDADLVFMHSLTVPPRKDVLLPADVNPVNHLLRWAEEKIARLESQGIDSQRLIFDPGIGFGTTPEQAFSLLRDIRRFHALGVRLLVGHSRKGFIAHAMTDSSLERDIETTALSQHLARSGVHYIRVHDVAMNARALKVTSLVGGSVEILP
jgi:dihydropteroate synthase